MNRASVPGIRDIGVEVGEIELGLDELARIHSVDRTVLEDALESRRIVITRRSRLDLAHEAASACLRRAGVEAADVDLILNVRGRGDPFGSEPGPPLSARLGATSARTLSIVAPCGNTLSTIDAAALFLSSPRIRRVLLVYAEVHPYEYRCDEPIDETFMTNMMSDGAAAALLEQGGRFRPVGFGFASNDATWPLVKHIQENGDPRSKTIRRDRTPMDLQLMKDFFDLTKAAFDRCVSESGRPLAPDDVVVLTAILPRLARAVARKSGIPSRQLVDAEGRCHVFGADALITLANLDSLGTRTGRVFIGDIGLGASSFAAFEIDPPSAKP